MTHIRKYKSNYSADTDRKIYFHLLIQIFIFWNHQNHNRQANYFATIEGLITGLTGPLNVSYIQYIFENLAAVPMYFLLLYLITVIFKPEVTLNSKKYFENEYQKMGSMSQDEKKAIGVCLILLILVLTTNIHHVSAMYCFTIVPIMLYFPLQSP